MITLKAEPGFLEFNSSFQEMGNLGLQSKYIVVIKATKSFLLAFSFYFPPQA